MLTASSGCSLLFEDDNKTNSVENRPNANNKERDSQKVIFAALRTCCRQHKRLLSVESFNIKIICDLEGVLACLESVGQTAVQFSEVWKRGRSHPHHEVLIGHIDPLEIFPGLSFQCVVIRNCVFFDVFEFVFYIGVPGDFLIID